MLSSLAAACSRWGVQPVSVIFFGARSECFCRNDVDLNRAFPDRLATGNNLTATGREPAEALAVMRLGTALPFAAGASMHEGALVVSYPWDAAAARGYAASPDDGAYVALARSFAATHEGLRGQEGPPPGAKGIAARPSCRVFILPVV